MEGTNSAFINIKYKQDTLFTKAYKNLFRRITICIRAMCCLPLDKIIPSERVHRVFIRPDISQTLDKASIRQEKDVNELMFQIKPRSIVSVKDCARVSEGDSLKKARLKKSKGKIFKSKSKKKGSVCFLNSVKKSTNSIKSSGHRSVNDKKKCKTEKRWVRIMKKSNPHMKWMKSEMKRREILTSSCTDTNEESAGDGPPTPSFSVRTIKKIPIQCLRNIVSNQNYSDTYVDYIKKDVVKRVKLV